MKKETIIIVSVLGVGILGFLGYKWYKNKSSLNSKFIENKNLVKKPIKKASPTSKQVDKELAIYGGLETLPLNKKN